jgi:DNA-binding NarL/FixJ family response regulator
MAVMMSIRLPFDEESQRITVLIVDDDSQFRLLASELLADQGYDVVGWAGTVSEAIAAQARLDPDAVLLDVRLPDGSGVALARKLSANGRGPKILLTSTDRQAVAPGELRESGATGFVPKTELAQRELAPFLGR